jgi:Putative transposase
VRSRHRQQRRRRQPYLVDNKLLSRRFRDKFLAGLKRLHRDGKLKLNGKWFSLQELAAFEAWLTPLGDCAWAVFIEPPPTEQSQPEHVLKYLARYLTGGPISDRRLIDHQDDEVTFWARSPDKKAGNRPKPYTLPGVEFTRRWALHILPKGFVKSRCFGGFSCRHRQAYLRRCRALLGAEPPAPESAQTPPEEPKPTRICPKCQTPLECISQVERPGWNRVLNGPDRPGWYDPFGHALAWGGLHWYREPPDG